MAENGENIQKKQPEKKKEVIIFPAIRWEASEWDGVKIPAVNVPEWVVEVEPWDDFPPWVDFPAPPVNNKGNTGGQT